MFFYCNFVGCCLCSFRTATTNGIVMFRTVATNDTITFRTVATKNTVIFRTVATALFHIATACSSMSMIVSYPYL